MRDTLLAAASESTNTLRLADYQRGVHETAVAHGWWDQPRAVLEALALVHAEISEAVEEYRIDNANLADVRRSDTGKPEGFGVELADAIIRILDLCEHLGIDMETLLTEKNEYNRTRPYRHGKLA